MATKDVLSHPTAKCPDEVEQLLEHLRISGTGKGKLERIRDLGVRSKTAQEFMDGLPKIVPEGTLQKIKDWVGQVESGKIDVKKPKSGPKPFSSDESFKKAAEESKAAREEASKRVKEQGGDPNAVAKDAELADYTRRLNLHQNTLQPANTPTPTSPGFAGTKDIREPHAPKDDPSSPSKASPKARDLNQETHEAGVQAEGTMNDPNKPDNEGNVRDESKSEGDDAKSHHEEGEVKSPVADDNATDAKDKISRMTSTEKLEQIVMSDKRVTVQEAAQKRLDELQQK